MASSDFDTYGNLLVKQVGIDAPSGVKFHDPDDDTKTITLKASGLGAGNVDVSLPTQAGALLNASSSLNGARLTSGSVATASLSDDCVTAAKIDIASAADIGAGGASGDSMLISDADDSNNVKRITITQLSSLVGGDSLPSATDAQMLISSGANNFQSQTLGGDVTVNASGSVTVANASISAAKLASNSVTNVKVDSAAAIEFSKLENLPSAQILVGSATNKANARAMSGDCTINNSGAVTIANNAITNAKVSATPADSIAGSKILPNFAARKVETTSDMQVGGSSAFYIGAENVDGSWRIIKSGSDLVMQVRASGTWSTRSTITA